MAFSPNSNRSTKGASKQRRDLINMEIDNLKDLLPLPETIRQRLFQLQIMSLVCIFIRKERYLPHIFGDSPVYHHMQPAQSPHCYLAQQRMHQQMPSRQIGNGLSKLFDSCKALRGFLLMVTRQGKLLYISDNATDYLGHSVEEIMSQGDSLYDLVDPRDHSSVQAELLSGPPSVSMHMRFPDERVFICRMNLSRAAKRQLQYQKFVIVHGRYLQPAEYYQALLTLTAPELFIHPVFAAFCQPLITPENAESLCAGNTTVFCSLHQMDMTLLHFDEIGGYHLGYCKTELTGKSWYTLVHPNDLPEVGFKHKLLCDDKETSCIILLRLQSWSGTWLWLHTVLAVREGGQKDNSMEQLIMATYQMLTDIEAATLQANSWIYNLPHRYAESTLSLLSSRSSGLLAESLNPQSPGLVTSRKSSELTDPMVSPASSTSKPARRKFSRSQSAGKNMSKPSLLPGLIPNRSCRHSYSEASPFFYAGDSQTPSTSDNLGGINIMALNGLTPPEQESSPLNGDSNVFLDSLNQIRVEIPSAYQQILGSSSSEGSTAATSLLSHFSMPSLLTPESSPADSNGSSGHSANGHHGNCHGPAGHGRAPLASSTLSRANIAALQKSVNGINAITGLPEIDSNSLEAFFRQVESETVLAGPQDPLLSGAGSKPRKSTAEENPHLRQLLETTGRISPLPVEPCPGASDQGRNFGLSPINISNGTPADKTVMPMKNGNHHQQLHHVNSFPLDDTALVMNNKVPNVNGTNGNDVLDEPHPRVHRLNSWAGFSDS